MESEGQLGWLLAGVALLVTLICCFGLVLVAGGGSLLYLRSQQAEVQTVPTATLGGTELASTPVSSPADQAPTPSEAFTTRELIADTHVPIADPIDLVERLMGVEDVPRVLSEQAEPLEAGAEKTFWASNVDSNTNFRVEAELAYVTEHVYFWVEKGVDYDLEDVEALVDEFETDIYPTNREFFGSEWSPGVDGDEHLYMLFARGLGNSIAGYFASNDSYPPEVHEFSNGHEMFYLSADNLNLRSDFTYGVLAHEFQHMIHWNLDRNEATWMNEGFAEVATLLNEYDVGGFDRAYASRPDLTLTYWSSEPGTNTANYGQSFLFMAYYLQRFGSEASQALVRNEENGLDSIDNALAELNVHDEASGEPMTADDLYRDWAAALLLQDSSLADGRYGISIYRNPPRASLTDRFDSCPVRAEERTVFPYGVDYVQVRCEGPQTLVFDGSSLARVVPADPHSGDYAVWSNRGDESDMVLTRSFDFTEVEGELTFSYWTWYDIEEGWDYLYLEASTDGGETWEILQTPSGTDEDPSGNSYGWAYTAKSGGGERARWIEESVDLSGFAGEEILLRFEYVTDAAVNGEGLLLDDLRIEAVDYEEDFEDGIGGWQAEGFVRMFNRLPQSYRLVLVEEGDDTQISDIPLGEGQRAEIDLPFGEGVDQATLVIINTTRHTWQPSPYTISVSP